MIFFLSSQQKACELKMSQTQTSIMISRDTDFVLFLVEFVDKHATSACDYN